MAITRLKSSTFSKGLTKNTSAWDGITTGGIDVEYLVVGGGGAGGSNDYGGGGGAGGYRAGTLSTPLNAELVITIGAGGAGNSPTSGPGASGSGNFGTRSVFHTITANGGGGGGGQKYRNGHSGGSGGGSAGLRAINPGGIGNILYLSTPEGYAGGTRTTNLQAPGGGGSAGAGTVNGTGGSGTANSISGSSITYAVGGNGIGDISTNGGEVAGTNNRGNGGGGFLGIGPTSGAGGSGIVILKFLDSRSLSVGAGLTSTNTTSGGYKIYTFTAGTGMVVFS